MTNKRFLLGMLVLALVFGMLVVGCDDKNDLPISFINYEWGDDGFCQFYNNDPQYYGWAYWYILTTNYNDPDTFEIECKKMSGAYNYGYGMAFGAPDTSKFYYVLITTDGYYSVQKRNGSSDPVKIRDWAKTSQVVSGYNKANRIKVVRTYPGPLYTVYLNDTLVHNFTDSEITGNRVGFYASIGKSNEESFPNTPVDVRFRQCGVAPSAQIYSPALRAEMGKTSLDFSSASWR